MAFDYVSVGSQIGGGLETALMYIFGIAAGVGAIWFVWFWLQFKTILRIREVIKDRSVISDSKARSYKDKKGVLWLQVWGSWTKLPEPPSECVEISSKGKKMIEYYKTHDGSFIPIQDTFDYTNFKKEYSATFKPFPTNERQLLVNELRESEDYRKNSLGEKILGVLPYLAIIMILVIFMIFFKEVVAPFGTAGDKLVVGMDKMNTAVESMRDICLERVRLQPNGGVPPD